MSWSRPREKKRYRESIVFRELSKSTATPVSVSYCDVLEATTKNPAGADGRKSSGGKDDHRENMEKHRHSKKGSSKLRRKRCSQTGKEHLAQHHGKIFFVCPKTPARKIVLCFPARFRTTTALTGSPHPRLQPLLQTPNGFA